MKCGKCQVGRIKKYIFHGPAYEELLLGKKFELKPACQILLLEIFNKKKYNRCTFTPFTETKDINNINSPSRNGDGILLKYLS